jgi:hypothetical protein
MAAFGGDSQFFYKGPLDDDLLTVTYLDVLGQSPMLVRTYMYKFPFQSADKFEEFVVGIDIHHRDEQAVGLVPNFGSQTSYGRMESSSLRAGTLGIEQYGVFASLLALFWVVRWVAGSKLALLSFLRTSFIYGDVTFEQGQNIERDENFSRQASISIGLEKILKGKLESRVETKDSTGSYIKASRSQSATRGVEDWEVPYRTNRFLAVIVGEF